MPELSPPTLIPLPSSKTEPPDVNVSLAFPLETSVITEITPPASLYSEDAIEKIKLLTKYVENPYKEDEKDKVIDSSFVNGQDINSEFLVSDKIFTDLKSDYLDENEFRSDLIDSDMSNSSNDNSVKYHLKGIEEIGNYSNITDFEMENMEGAQAKLEGSLLRRIKNFLIDEKGMLINIVESENITITQPGNESLNTLTEEEEKMKNEIYNDNNEIPVMDDEELPGSNITFDISNIKCVNFNNVSLYNSIINETLAKNLFKYFDSFSYTKYNTSENEDLKFRLLKEFKDDFLKENPDYDPSEVIVEGTF